MNRIFYLSLPAIVLVFSCNSKPSTTNNNGSFSVNNPDDPAKVTAVSHTVTQAETSGDEEKVPDIALWRPSFASPKSPEMHSDFTYIPMDKKMFADYQQPYEEIWIDPSKDQVVTTKNGTSFYIPAGSIVQKNGNKTMGEIKILYREYRDLPDLIISEIPMKYGKGENEYLETGGMFEIWGEDKEGNALKIKEGSNVLAEQPVNETDPAYNFYYLEDNTWSMTESDVRQTSLDKGMDEKFAIRLQVTEDASQSNTTVNFDWPVGYFPELAALRNVPFKVIGKDTRHIFKEAYLADPTLKYQDIIPGFPFGNYDHLFVYGDSIEISYTTSEGEIMVDIMKDSLVFMKLALSSNLGDMEKQNFANYISNYRGQSQQGNTYWSETREAMEYLLSGLVRGTDAGSKYWNRSTKVFSELGVVYSNGFTVVNTVTVFDFGSWNFDIEVVPTYNKKVPDPVFVLNGKWETPGTIHVSNLKVKSVFTQSLTQGADLRISHSDQNFAWFPTKDGNVGVVFPHDFENISEMEGYHTIPATVMKHEDFIAMVEAGTFEKQIIN